MNVVVRSTDVDRLGHVNNAKYLEYLEWARIDWYEKAGVPVNRLFEQNIGTVVVNVNINFRHEARMGDVLTIVTRPKRKGNTSFVLEQVIENRDGQTVAEADVTSVAFDLVKRKSIPLLPELDRAFSAR